jgi:hypothetical protein
VLKARSSFFFSSLTCHFPPLAEFSQVLTLAYDVVQLRKIWSCIRMMVPMLKLHPSSVEFPVVFVVNGASSEADFISVFVISLF